MDYLTRTMTLTAAVTGYTTGDYAVFYSNAGAGAVDFDTEISTHRLLEGETSVTFIDDPGVPGSWEWSIKAADSKDNLSTSVDVTSYVDLEPAKPDAMTLNAYDSVADELILNL